MKTILLIFPHQLFMQHPGLELADNIVLVEEYLFFRQYPFHKSKLAYHRAGMKFYESYLIGKGKTVKYIEAGETDADIRHFISSLPPACVTLVYADTCDNWLEKRISQSCHRQGIPLKRLESPLFINTNSDIDAYFKNQGRLFQTDFYVKQRRQRQLLTDPQDGPIGGKWSFDAENRLKYPKDKTVPELHSDFSSPLLSEAIEYTETHFPDNPGGYKLTDKFPHTFEQAELWLEEFIRYRLHDFGQYEDAMLEEEVLLNHSLLTPALNCGLIAPQTIIDRVIEAYHLHPTLPLNSVEGFIRQILGWRELIRLVYITRGTEERTRNFWGFDRKIPASFWNGTTGIRPVDLVIKRVLDNAYCHHIERLMVLGNFMLLCEFDPDEVYEWFMTLFIDAYDWVMVPNVYGMSQFADGGRMATKPYISGSNYLKKMSDFESGAWTEIWDALFWRFIAKQRGFFESNPRLGMMLRTWDKMDPEKQNRHLSIAQNFLDRLSSYSSGSDQTSTA